LAKAGRRPRNGPTRRVQWTAGLRLSRIPGVLGPPPLTCSVSPLNSMKTIILALLVLGTMLVQAEEKLSDEALAKKGSGSAAREAE